MSIDDHYLSSMHWRVDPLHDQWQIASVLFFFVSSLFVLIHYCFEEVCISLLSDHTTPLTSVLVGCDIILFRGAIVVDAVLRSH